MARIPEFLNTLKQMEEVHVKKNEDYADSNNPFSNFDVSEYLISQFKHDRDKTFVWPIATKLARLATLLNGRQKPNNESIEDSMVDIANYVILWKCDYQLNKGKRAFFENESPLYRMLNDKANQQIKERSSKVESP